MKQLNLINLSRDDQIRAISDFLQSSADKTIWAEKGLIVRGSLNEYDDDLVRQHGLHRIEIDELLSGKSKEAQGRILYSRCTHLKGKLEGREVPGYFIPGCYNDLANRLRVGWHPEYETKLDERGD